MAKQQQPAPARGQIVQREPSGGNSDNAESDELHPMLEGVLSLFEQLGGEKVKFGYVQVSNQLPCHWCGEATGFRLTAVRSGEESRQNVCDVCKAAIAAA